MADEKKKNRSVEPTVMEWSRYLVLDKCLRDQHRYYHMEDLWIRGLDPLFTCTLDVAQSCAKLQLAFAA